MQNRNKKGFTLIELVVATLIIGLLAAVLVPNALGARARANGAAVQTFLKNLAQEMEFTYSDDGAYYPTGDAVDGLFPGEVVAFGIQTFFDEFIEEDGGSVTVTPDEEWPFPIDKPRDVTVAFKTDGPDAHSGYCVVARWNSRDTDNYFSYMLTPDAGIQTLTVDSEALDECPDYGTIASVE